MKSQSSSFDSALSLACFSLEPVKPQSLSYIESAKRFEKQKLYVPLTAIITFTCFVLLVLNSSSEIFSGLPLKSLPQK